jgi:hypothetical protein
MMPHTGYTEVLMICVFFTAGVFAHRVGRALFRKIQRAIYFRGSLPKPGNIFFSPSLNLVKRYENAKQEMTTTPVIIPASQESVTPLPLTLIQRMRYCPECEASLDEFELGKKECPRGCGYLYSRENAEGLEAITFEPYTLEDLA